MIGCLEGPCYVKRSGNKIALLRSLTCECERTRFRALLEDLGSWCETGKKIDRLPCEGESFEGTVRFVPFFLTANGSLD